MSPVEYLADLGFLDSRVLAVHGVQFTGDDLARLRALGTTVVSCPRSNRYVGVGVPPLEAFYAMGVNVAFGTDSLASVRDLNMFAELAAARRLAPRVPARDAARERHAAAAPRALGFGDDFGSIEAGKRAALIAVRVPAGVAMWKNICSRNRAGCDHVARFRNSQRANDQLSPDDRLPRMPHRFGRWKLAFELTKS